MDLPLIQPNATDGMWLTTFGFIEPLVFYILCAAGAVILVLSIVTIVIPCCLNRGLSPGSSIDFYVVLGGLFLAFTVLVRGLLPSWTDLHTLEILCQFYPSTLLVGLTLFIGGLFVKVWCMFAFFRCYGFAKGKAPYPLRGEWIPNLLMWLLLLLMGGVCVAWTILHTPTVVRSSEYLYACYGPHEFEWKTATAAWHGLLLILTVICVPMQCATSRNSPAARESTFLTFVVINTLLVVVTSLCIFFLFDAYRTILYAIQGGLTMWMVVFADIMLLTARVQSDKAARGVEDNPYDRYDTIHAHSEGIGSRSNSRPNSFPPDPAPEKPPSPPVYQQSASHDSSSDIFKY